MAIDTKATQKMHNELPSLESHYVAQLKSILPNIGQIKGDETDEEYEVVLSAIQYIRYLRHELALRGYQL